MPEPLGCKFASSEQAKLKKKKPESANGKPEIDSRLTHATRQHVEVMLENLRRHYSWLKKRKDEGATAVQEKMVACGKKKEELELQNRALKIQAAFRARVGKRRFVRIWKEHTAASTLIQRAYRDYKNRALGKEQGIKQMDKMVASLYRKMRMPAKRALASVRKVYENIVEDPRGAPNLESRILDNAVSR